MPCDSTERGRVVVVHFTDEQAAAARVVLQWHRRRGLASRSGRQLKCDRIVCGGVLLWLAGVALRRRRQRGGNRLPLRRDRGAAAIGGDKPEQDESEIAVD